MEKRFGKTDVILLAVIFCALAGIWIFTLLRPQKEGASAVITVDGKIYKEVSLKKNQEVEILKDGVTTNLLIIQDGRADMIEADCPDKLCVHQKAVSKTGETIVCLPNKVVVEVKGAEDMEFDSIVK